MRRFFYTLGLLFGLLSGPSLYAQMGIGTTLPDPAAQLEVKANHRGVLIPRIALNGPTDQTTITAGNVESLLVYNTAVNNGLSPGYYYWYNGQWTRLLNENNLPADLAFYDVANQEFYYIDTNGNHHPINIGSGTETLTVLSLNPDGHTLDYKDENGNTVSVDLTPVIQAHQKTVSVSDGLHTSVQSNSAGNNTDYQVDVPTADAQHLGVVKEAAENPTVAIDSNGALQVNLENLNTVKVVQQDYAATPADHIILGQAETANITITLPNPVTHKGKAYTIKKEDGNEDFYVFVSGEIAGLSGNQQLYTAIPYTGWAFVSDGNQWRIIDKF